MLNIIRVVSKKQWSVAGLAIRICLVFGRGLLAQEATLIVFNGKIATVDEKNTIVEAMALGDDVIVALGKNNDVLKLAGPNTRKLDVGGRTVLPGIIDPHWHLAN